MTVNRTTLLDLPLPVTGTESNTWGDITNNGLTEYMDIAIAGMSNLTSANFTAGALTIETTEGNSAGTSITATSAQYAGFRVTSLAANSTITVGNTGTSPARSYRLINADATYNLTFKATGQTGVTLLPGQSAVVAFNGTDYVIVGTVGAGTATDNAVARFDGTTGEILQNSAATIDDTGAATFVGSVNVSGTSASAADLKLYEDTDNGTNYVAFKSPASVASNVTWTLPSADGTNGQALTTNGSGTLAFSSVTTAPGGSTTQVQYNNAGAFGGSANFVWDNSNVRLGIGTSSPAVPLDVVAQTSASIARFRGRSSDNIATLEWYDNTNATRYTYISSGPSSSSFWNQANTPMAFGTNDTERMRITSAGNVGIGTSSPQTLLQVSSVTPIISLRESDGAADEKSFDLRVNSKEFSIRSVNDAYSAANNVIAATRSTGIDIDNVRFFTGAGSERMRINADGTIKTSATISVGDATPSTSGAGITFPATQSASTDANTLDDYEEGTWTPTVSGSSTAGTGTYSTQVGTYTKIGRQVTINCWVAWSAHTGSGNLQITNLPFTSNSTANAYNSATFGYTNNLALSANNVALAHNPNNSSRIDVYQYPVGGGANAPVSLDTDASIMISLTYPI